MAFPEHIRKKVLERAHYSCCVCQKAGMSIEVHHIDPSSQGGGDDEENAAPMCPTCHEDYGDNPIKRKATKERRDFWYELCRKREEPKIQWVEMADKLEKTASKDDLNRMGSLIVSEISTIINQPGKPLYQIKRELGSFTGTLGSITSGLPGTCPRCRGPLQAEPGVVNMATCRVCGWAGPVNERGKPE